MAKSQAQTDKIEQSWPLTAIFAHVLGQFGPKSAKIAYQIPHSEHFASVTEKILLTNSALFARILSDSGSLENWPRLCIKILGLRPKTVTRCVR